MKKQKNLKESTRLVNKVVFLVIISSIVFGILTFLTSFISSTLSAKGIALQKYSTELKYSSDEITYQTKLYALTGNKAYYENVIKEVNVEKNMEKSLNEIKKIGVTKKETILTKDIDDLTEELAILEDEAITYVKEGNLKKAQDLIFGSSYESLKSKIDNDIQSFQGSILSRSKKNTLHSTSVLFVFLSITIALMIFVLYIISRYSKFINNNVINPIIILKDCFTEISKGNLNASIPIKEDHTEIGTLSFTANETQKMLKSYIDDITYTLNNMANGNITGKIEREYTGDFIEIKSSINHILESLNSTLSNISLAANEVSQGAQQMAESSSSLSEGACEQTYSIEELKSTIDNIYIKTKSNSDNSKNVSNIINGTIDKLKISDIKMNEMLLAMDKISTSSNEISKILSTINSIAFQTNLLAVNTSIEASRAGINGKQFAVIAEEVKKLADDAATAAKTTSTLIADSLLAVIDGNSLANETANVLHEIVDDTNKISSLLNDISLGTSEQEISTRQITKGMEEISRIVENNASTAEEGSAISQELASQAEMLNETVSAFTLE